MAVPLAVAACTVTVWLLGPDSDTVKTALTLPVFPSVTETLLIDRAEVSSSTIVPVPVALPRAALVGPDRVTVKVSLFSSTVSPSTVTETVLAVSPGAKVTVPVAAV